MALPPELLPKTLSSLVKSDITAPPCYIEPSVLPVGGQLILASQAKTGKSFMMLELGRSLASADAPFAAPELFCPRACRVLMIEQELGEHGLKKRADVLYTDEEVKRQGFMADNFLYISKQPDLKLDTAKGLKLIYQICEEVEPDVLMLDPLGRFHNINENDNQAVSQLWGEIDQLQKTFPRMSLIASMHMSKPPDVRAGFDLLDPYRIRGASKHFDNVDGVITANRTHDLKTKHQSWAAVVRYTLRHGESPDDQVLHFNEKHDGRVRYYKTVGGEDAKTEPVPWQHRPQTTKPTQLAFQPAG